MPKVLLVDDDCALREILTAALEERFLVISAVDGQTALAQIIAEHPDLVLLDLTLPDIDGVLLITKIRQMSHVPICVLSARHKQADRVLSLKLGADDFICKPFDLDDLDARIDAVLRRSTPPRPTEPRQTCGTLSLSKVGGARIDGRPFHLTPTEYSIVELLVSRSPEIIPLAVIRERVWGSADWPLNLMRLHVGRIRQRLGCRAHAPQITTTVGRGYSIRPAV